MAAAPNDVGSRTRMAGVIVACADPSRRVCAVSFTSNGESRITSESARGSSMALSVASAIGSDTVLSKANDAASEPMDVPGFHAARKFAGLPYGRIAYVERGRGSAALFLHGYPLNGYQWRGALSRLSTYRRCIPPDFLGLGYTEAPEGADLRPGTQMAMLEKLLDAIGEKTIDI